MGDTSRKRLLIPHVVISEEMKKAVMRDVRGLRPIS